MIEQWKPVMTATGVFPFYSVSDLGRIRVEPHPEFVVAASGRRVRARDERTYLTPRHRETKPGVFSMIVRVVNTERVLDTQLDQVVLRSHEPEFAHPKGAGIVHWNGDVTDCRLENLEWQGNLRTDRKERANPHETFLEEYRFFREFGWDHAQIAEKLGITVGALEHRVRKLDCWTPAPGEKNLVDALNRLVASKRPFMASQLSKSESLAEVLIRAELKAGRIRVSHTPPLYKDNRKAEVYVAA